MKLGGFALLDRRSHPIDKISREVLVGSKNTVPMGQRRLSMGSWSKLQNKIREERVCFHCYMFFILLDPDIFSPSPG